MSKTAIYTWVVIIIILVLLIIWWIWAASMPSTTSTPPTSTNTTPNTIQLGQSTTLGAYLTDSKGVALYYFANDTAGVSNCTGACQTIWPAFYTANVTVPNGLDPADFGSIATSSGGNQTTYKGMPLYYYSGDVTGNGVQKIWFVVKNPFYNVMVMNNSTSKTYLANPQGLAIYYYSLDKQGTANVNPVSNCDSTCMGSNWTIFDQSQVVAPSLLKSSDFIEFTRPDGQTQLSYKGWPLYLYAGDTASGDAKGTTVKSWKLILP